MPAGVQLVIELPRPQGGPAQRSGRALQGGHPGLHLGLLHLVSGDPVVVTLHGRRSLLDPGQERPALLLQLKHLVNAVLFFFLFHSTLRCRLTRKKWAAGIIFRPGPVAIPMILRYNVSLLYTIRPVLSISDLSDGDRAGLICKYLYALTRAPPLRGSAFLPYSEEKEYA